METKGGGHVGRNLVNGEQLEQTDTPCRYAHRLTPPPPPSAVLSQLSHLFFSPFPPFVTFFLKKVLD